MIASFFLFFVDRVELECSDLHGNQPPKLLSSDDPCHFDIKWSTVHACPEKIETGSNCVVTDELYDVTYDLSHIKSDKFYSAGDQDGLI